MPALYSSDNILMGKEGFVILLSVGKSVAITEVASIPLGG
jgi:hypothetical protein